MSDARLCTARLVWIALGSNEPSTWGSCCDTITKALLTLCAAGVPVKVASDFFMTTAVGGGRQPAYINAVAGLETRLPPAALLRLFKRVERAAGRRLGRHWGPRPLDIDLLDARLVNRWHRHQKGRRRTGQLILPHPEMHRRAFVLAPLASIAPHWVHPTLNVGARRLLLSPLLQAQRRAVRRLPPLTQSDIFTSSCAEPPLMAHTVLEMNYPA